MITISEYLKFAIKPFIVVLIIFVSIFAYSKFGIPLKFAISSTSVAQPTPFSVTEEGKVYVTPDVATINLGIISDSATVQEAQKYANQKINDVTSKAKEMGIPSENIKTINYNIYPSYDYNNYPAGKIVSYKVSIELEIKVEDFEKINDVIDMATASGINQVNGISFGIKDRTESVNKATTIATQKAKEKAGFLAKSAGMNLGKIINIYTYENTQPYAYRSYEASGLGGGGAPQADTNVQPGQTEVVVSVTLTYETF